MSCLAPADITRAATTGELDPHFADCLACRRQLDADRCVRDQLQSLPVPRMSEGLRRSVAAEIMARAQYEVPARVASRRWSLPAAAAVAVAAAAAFALVAVRPSAMQDTGAPAPTVASGESFEPSYARAVHEAPTPPLPPPSIDASQGATLSHQIGSERDVLTLVDGVVSIDTTSSRDVDVRVGNATIRIDDASVKIRAHKHAIVSVQVVVGAAQVNAPDQHVTLQRDSLWLPGPSHADQSISAFRDGWIELRAGHNREAMELFARVTDPVVLEEAMYWAAVAAHRTGDRTLAEQRTQEFLRRFPQSEYASALRAK